MSEDAASIADREVIWILRNFFGAQKNLLVAIPNQEAWRDLTCGMRAIRFEFYK
jgi:hypothetical protein